MDIFLDILQEWSSKLTIKFKLYLKVDLFLNSHKKPYVWLLMLNLFILMEASITVWDSM